MKKATGKLNKALEDALAAELVEVGRKHAEDQMSEPVLDGDGKEVKPAKKTASAGDFVYPILDRMRVYDRALKLEQVKLKIDDPSWGAEFKDKG